MWATVALGVVAITQVVSSQSASSSSPIPVTGAQTGIDPNTGARPARLNINDLYTRGGPQWDLYVQALADFQAANESDESSYFQISGIHGLPFLPWNGAEQVPDGPTAGYCPHGEILFPAWHRPFVALFEQVLVTHALRIATKYPSRMRPQYQAAALSLRQPYWDWAVDHNLPLAAILPTLTVNTPDGPSTIRNPLSSYRFSNTPSGAGFGGALAKYKETVRCPVEGGTNDSELSDAELSLPNLPFTSQTYAVFAQSSKFEMMASASSPGPSFEAPHNNIHNYAGCPNGTLADIGWSAFEPLFMLHHSNVDRLIAMWQAIYYNASTMNTTGVSHGTFGTKEGSTVDVDTPLKPFFDNKLNYYTSRTASRIKDFGYTYPEINDWSTSPDELAAYVTSRVNDLYGQGLDSGPRSGPRRRAKSSSQQPVAYSAEIRVERSDVPLPCTIDLRLGYHVLGRMSLLSMPTGGMSYTSVPLGEALRRLNLGDMPEDTLLPYLQQNLEVEVRKRDGKVLSKLHSITSLAVDLQGQDVTPRRSNSELTRYGIARKWPMRKHI
ncbi:Di-copper centre-containing protein [Coniochaeta hoffmannii]|uniref:Di-copper centre-containing protein n=1 Tax=Coniochaeta hoffmannii TaxID=91930 RepID=A0AA38VH97_9PEZI|nr:Di-copper centre-containing protein [Coniochaeta hoffmannii]